VWRRDGDSEGDGRRACASLEEMRSAYVRVMSMEAEVETRVRTCVSSALSPSSSPSWAPPLATTRPRRPVGAFTPAVIFIRRGVLLGYAWLQDAAPPRRRSRCRPLFSTHPTRAVPVPIAALTVPVPLPVITSASVVTLPRLGCAPADVRDVEAGTLGRASHVPAHGPAFALAVLVLVIVLVIGVKTPRRAGAPRVRMQT
jgi:hypothetical protein